MTFPHAERQRTGVTQDSAKPRTLGLTLDRVNELQQRVLGRIADEIVRFRAGEQTLLTCLNRIWGLYTAAELRDDALRETFERLYYAVSVEDDALQPGMPEGIGSQDRLIEALAELEAWAADVRDPW